MAEYIDREAFKKSVEERYCKPCKAEEAVDAVPVVRCKDCKYYKISELHPPFKFCFRLRHPTENRSVGYRFADDDFCSYGECREGKDG